tara:strand:+ start:308 stop:568 length:261 start_codon:yes stop_codon:yes gene_type:complete
MDRDICQHCGTEIKPLRKQYNLTPKQLSLLAYIQKYIEDRQVAPTIPEMAEHEGISSNSIKTRLDSLEKRGHIKRIKYAKRSITLT